MVLSIRGVNQENILSVDKVVFVLDHKLHDYRVPLFNRLSSCFDVTVVHRGPMIEGVMFSQVILEYCKLGPFEYIKRLRVKSYDIVVFMQNLRVLNIYFSFALCCKVRVLFWGIGTSSSNGLGKDLWLLGLVRNVLTLFSGGLALYSKFPLPQYWRVNRNKISVVGNSVESVGSPAPLVIRSHFLFIGTLNKRKGLLELIESFSRCLVVDRSMKLLIAGDGPERFSVEKAILELGIEGNVEMLGRVTSAAAKSDIFSGAHAVISPFQAGLSVVEAFSFGVPFVTSRFAITGGESLSIVNNVNGVLFESIQELDDIFLSFLDGRRDSREMGCAARACYDKELSFDCYVHRFENFLSSDKD